MSEQLTAKKVGPNLDKINITKFITNSPHYSLSLKQIMNIKRAVKITNKELWRITKQKPIEMQIKKKKMELDRTHIT
jgi:hypothetical protein